MIIETPTLENAEGHVAEMYDGDLRSDGLVYGHTRALAMNPAAHQALEGVIRAIVSRLGLRNYELTTLAAARGIRSQHCLLAHGRKTARAGLMDDAQLIRVATDYRDADLSEAEVAMMAFAERMSTDAATMTDADSQVLRDHGFSDLDIVDIALAAGVRNLLSRYFQALAVPVDDVPGLDPAVAAALLSPTR